MKIHELDQNQEHKNDLFAFVNHPMGFMLMTGKNGTGKSTAAMAIYEILAPHRLPYYDHDCAWFITQADLNILWLKKISQWNDTSYLQEEISNTKLLILDDLGTKPPSEPFNEFLYSLAEKRYSERAKLGTIITTNLTSKGLREMFGDAFFSRAASGRCIKFEGKDRRFV